MVNRERERERERERKRERERENAKCYHHCILSIFRLQLINTKMLYLLFVMLLFKCVRILSFLLLFSTLRHNIIMLVQFTLVGYVKLLGYVQYSF